MDTVVGKIRQRWDLRSGEVSDSQMLAAIVEGLHGEALASFRTIASGDPSHAYVAEYVIAALAAAWRAAESDLEAVRREVLEMRRAEESLAAAEAGEDVPMFLKRQAD